MPKKKEEKVVEEPVVEETTEVTPEAPTTLDLNFAREDLNLLAGKLNEVIEYLRK